MVFDILWPTFLNLIWLQSIWSQLVYKLILEKKRWTEVLIWWLHIQNKKMTNIKCMLTQKCLIHWDCKWLPRRCSNWMTFITLVYHWLNKRASIWILFTMDSTMKMCIWKYRDKREKDYSLDNEHEVPMICQCWEL